MKNRIFILFALIILIGSASAVEEIIKPGNILNITVMGYPELSKSVLVYEDGTVDYPLLANIPVDGLTTAELSELLIPVLTRFIDRPRLFINIAHYQVREVKVLGQVKVPGTQTVEGEVDLQELIAQAGGPQAEADLRNVRIIRNQDNVKTEITVDLLDLYQEDNSLEAMPKLEQGDVIIIPALTPNSYVKVYGTVRQPGMYLPTPGMNIADIINMAGGPLETADLDNVVLVREQDNHYNRQEIDLEKILDEGIQEAIPQIAAGDVVIVPQKEDWKDFSFWARLIRDAVYLTSAIVLISNM